MSEQVLAGRSAVVTGASSGMGQAIAVEMARAGARVTALGRDEARLRTTVDSIQDDGGTVHPLVSDLNSHGAAEDVVHAAVSQFGSLDVLANVAGVMELGSLADTSLESLERQWATNVRAPYALTKAALPHLREANGSVIFISSTAAMAAFPDSSAYTATKGAIESLSRQLATELGPDGVRVNAIAPGEIDTPMNEDFYRENPDFLEQAIAAIPARRVGQAVDVAHAAVFLASDAASFVYGATVPVDGGQLAT